MLIPPFPPPSQAELDAGDRMLRRKRAVEYLPFLAELYRGAAIANDEELKADVREKILKHLKNI